MAVTLDNAVACGSSSIRFSTVAAMTMAEQVTGSEENENQNEKPVRLEESHTALLRCVERGCASQQGECASAWARVLTPF
jgi:hypothetical protein